MPPLLSAKVVLVTGAGSGIGQATALTMAREGASVVIADRDEAAGTATLEMITGQGGRGLTIIVDTSQAQGRDARSTGGRLFRTARLRGEQCGSPRPGRPDR